MKVEYFMGDKDLASVRLSPQERAQLARAARILRILRARLDENDPNADDDMAVDVALAAHLCKELSDEGVVNLP